MSGSLQGKSRKPDGVNVDESSLAMPFSRRGMLTGLAAVPALTLAAAPGDAEAAGIDATIAATHAALKDPKGTKLVILGTGAGPVPGSARHMTSHVLSRTAPPMCSIAASA